MRITEDTINYLQDFVQLLLLLREVRGHVDYIVDNDISKFNNYIVVGISIKPTSTV